MPGPKGNAVIGQSGGPTAVINRSFVGAIIEARKHTEIEEFWGALHGIQGMLDDEYVPLFRQPHFVLDQIARTPAAALGSVRKKPNREECKRIFDNFKKRNVRYFFYIGGNDSAETAHVIDDFAEDEGYDLRSVHIPKTIDNDLLVTDHCPGYGSAARYVAAAFMGDKEDNRALQGVKINVCMGRNAGFLTAASVLARQYPKDGPHLVYLPEAPFDIDRFLGDLDGVLAEYGRALVAVSEGINVEGNANVPDDAKPTYWSQTFSEWVSIDLPGRYRSGGEERTETDSHGNVQLSGSGTLGDVLAAIVRSKLGTKRVRADTLGYPQRSFPLCISETDAREAFMVGVDAVLAATQPHFDEGSLAIRRIENVGEYRSETFITPLSSVQRYTKRFPVDWIHGGNNVDERLFGTYADPLVGELPMTGRFIQAVY
jgi:6-phosphofructokinase 1